MNTRIISQLEDAFVGGLYKLIPSGYTCSPYGKD